ncbi:Na+/solute symporter [gamma proteobacterium HTCC5015]|nr:Na+/solute symporter [gamma proteobacterium HTCC5015]
MIATSFIAFLSLFLLIGISSAFVAKKTAHDYLIANQSVPPWLVGLSAVATNNSGYMFIGMIGVTYSTGLSSLWIMIGWIIGDLTASLLSVTRIRQASERKNINSFGGLIAHWHGQDHRQLRRLVGFFTVFFLTVYAAAQLKAGSKATSVLLDWQPETGIIAGAAIVLVYSLSGGLRASIWTDAAQSMVMMVGMLALMGVGIHINGGLSSSLDQLHAVSDDYMNLMGDMGAFEGLLFIIGWFFGGTAVIGQPHVIIRFMSISSTEQVKNMRVYYYLWFTFFYAATVMVGLLCRLIFPEAGSFDPELALPKMAQSLLPDVFVGLVLAALFAATLSTADSLILSCSAAATRDFFSGKGQSLIAAKISTFSVLSVAVWIALSNNQTVFNLVLDAWGLLASAFVPLILNYCFGRRLPEYAAMATVIIGVVVFVTWNKAGLGGLVYSVAPGTVAGLITFAVLHRLWGDNEGEVHGHEPN